MISRGCFAGKVAVVTCAAQGIGRAVALRLAREGGGVALVDRFPLVEEVQQDAAAAGAKTVAIIADLETFFWRRCSSRRCAGIFWSYRARFWKPIEPTMNIRCNRASSSSSLPRRIARVRSKSSVSAPRCWHAKLHKFTPLRHEAVMTIQFSKQSMVVLSDGLLKMRSGLVPDSFVPGTIPARSASACGSSPSMTLNYSRASA